MSKKDIVLDNWKEYLREVRIREKTTPEDFKDVYNTARMAHVGQTRRDGSEYFSHPSQVRNIARKFYPKDNIAQMAALLHDSLEDAPGSTVDSVEEMEQYIKGSIQDPASAEEVIRVVRALTHEKGGDYLSYVVGLLGDVTTLRVKLADMVHNLTDNPSPKQKAKYKSALDAISSKTGGSAPKGISGDHWDTLMSLASVEVSEEVWDKEDGEYQRGIVKPKKNLNVMEQWQEYIKHKPILEDRDYIIGTLGVSLPVLEDGSYSLTDDLREAIIREHLIFEGFLDSMKSFVKGKMGEVSAFFKALYKIIKDPKAMTEYMNLVTNEIVDPSVQKIYSTLDKMTKLGEDTVEKVKGMIAKGLEYVKGLNGWLKFLGIITAGYILKEHVLKLIPRLVAGTAATVIGNLFSSPWLEALLKQATDFKQYLNGLTSGVGTVAKLVSTLAPVTDAFLASISEVRIDEKPAKGKKYSKTVTNPDTGRKKKVSYGAKGYRIAPGTSKGDSYCARSYGIKKGLSKDKQNDPNTPNNLSRKKWKCRGKKSTKEEYTRAEIRDVIREALSILLSSES